MFGKCKKWLMNDAPHQNPVTKDRMQKQYERHPSFADLWAIEDFNDEENYFILEDGLSVGAVLEIRDFPSETLTEGQLEKKHEQLVRLLYEIMPLHETNPWMGQFFVFTENTLKTLSQQQRAYVAPALINDSLTKDYCDMSEELFEQMCTHEGLLDDPLTQLPLRGGHKRIYFCIYRCYFEREKNLMLETTSKELKEVISQLCNRLLTDGFFVRQVNGARIFRWLTAWFNPKPQLTEESTTKLQQKFPYPDKKPHGWSFAQNIFFNQPQSFEDGWIFDNILQKALVIDTLHDTPQIGCIAREKAHGSLRFAFLDKLPPQSIYTVQIVFESQKKVLSHLAMIDKNAIGIGDEPLKVKENVVVAFDAIRQNNGLFKVAQAIFISASCKEELVRFENQIMNELADEKISAIRSSEMLNPVDAFLRFLPFNFRAQFDEKFSYYAQYLYTSDIAALVPLYGRSRIDDPIEPLNIFFNRAGEPIVFDTYSKAFKRGLGASHELYLGSTGFGKSVNLNHKVIQSLAIKNARVIAIEAGNSLSLTYEYVKSHNRKCTQIKFDRLNPVAINPYAEAYRALECIEREERALKAQSVDEALVHATYLTEKSNQLAIDMDMSIPFEHPEKEIENRDFLSEMVLATRTMITGGDAKEEERLIQSDNILIMEVLISAIKRCKTEGKAHVLTKDIVEEFDRQLKVSTHEKDRERLSEMGRNLAGFIKNPIRAQFVNRASSPLEDSDFLHVELGFLQEDNPVSKSMMSLMAISLLSKILAMAEKYQHSDRPTILVLDEVHLILKFPPVCAFLILMAKVARKYGLWLTLSTQNIPDFSGVDAQKILTLIETWFILYISEKERQELKKFIKISDETHALIENIFSPKGVYSEAVLLNPNHKLLMRHLPPRFILALSMTEQSEKFERQQLMHKHAISELDACRLIAKNLKAYKATPNLNRGFYD